MRRCRRGHRNGSFREGDRPMILMTSAWDVLLSFSNIVAVIVLSRMWTCVFCTKMPREKLSTVIIFNAWEIISGMGDVVPFPVYQKVFSISGKACQIKLLRMCLPAPGRSEPLPRGAAPMQHVMLLHVTVTVAAHVALAWKNCPSSSLFD